MNKVIKPTGRGPLASVLLLLSGLLLAVGCPAPAADDDDDSTAGDDDDATPGDDDDDDDATPGDDDDDATPGDDDDDATPGDDDDDATPGDDDDDATPGDDDDDDDDDDATPGSGGTGSASVAGAPVTIPSLSAIYASPGIASSPGTIQFGPGLTCARYNEFADAASAAYDRYIDDFDTTAYLASILNASPLWMDLPGWGGSVAFGNTFAEGTQSISASTTYFSLNQMLEGDGAPFEWEMGQGAVTYLDDVGRVLSGTVTRSAGTISGSLSFEGIWQEDTMAISLGSYPSETGTEVSLSFTFEATICP